MFRLRNYSLFLICFLFIVFIFSDKSFSEEQKDVFCGKVALITGSSSGLGKALSELAAEKKMKLILVDIDLSASKELADEINRNGGQAIAVRADLSKPSERKKVIDKATKKFKRIDYLFNNAAYIYAAKVEEIDLKEAHRSFEVNFWAYLDLAIRAIPIMRRQDSGGTIVNIASAVVSEDVTFTDIGAYTASKCAIEGVFRTLALEMKLEKSNIRVKIFCPEGMKTHILDNTVGPSKKILLERNTGYYKEAPEVVAERIFNSLS